MSRDRQAAPAGTSDQAGAGGPARASELIRSWSRAPGEKTLGSFIDAMDAAGFALLVVILMAPTALPIPTGGLTHIFELATVLLALQLIAGRQDVWLPARIRRVRLDGGNASRFVGAVERYVGKLEKITKPRGRIFFGNRASDVLFGFGVLLGTVAAAVAPPFSGLDTLPALGVVLLALSVLAKDILVIWVGVAVIAAGVFAEIFLADQAVSLMRSIL